MRIYNLSKILLVFLTWILLPSAFPNVTKVLRHQKDSNGAVFCSELGDVSVRVNYGGNVRYIIDWSVDGGAITTITTQFPPSSSPPFGARNIYLGRWGASTGNSSGNIVVTAELYEWLGFGVKGALLDTVTITLTLEQDGTYAGGGGCPAGWGLQTILGNLYGGDKPPGEINLQINVQNIDAPGEVEVEIQSSDGGSLLVSATEGNTNHGNQIFTGEDGETLTFWGRAIYGNQVVGQFAPIVGTYSTPADNVVFNFSYSLTEQGDSEEDGNLGITVVNNSGAPADYRVVDTATGETLASGSLQKGLNNIDLPLGAVMSGKNIALEASSDGVTWSRLDTKQVPQADVYQDDFGLHIQYPSANLSGVFGSGVPPVPSPPPQPTPNPAPSPDETITSSETESLATGESALQNVAVSDGGGIELEGGNIPEIPEIEPADDIDISLIFNKANEFLSNTFVPKSLGKVVRLDFGSHVIFDRVMDFSIPIPSWVDFFRRILHIILLYIFAVKTFYLFFRDGL